MWGQPKETRLNCRSEGISLPKSWDFILKALSLKCFKQRGNCGHIFIFKDHSFISVEKRLMEVRLETVRPIGRLAVAQAGNNETVNQGVAVEVGREGRMEESKLTRLSQQLSGGARGAGERVGRGEPLGGREARSLFVNWDLPQR